MKRIGYLYQEITDMKKIIDIYTKYVKKNTKNKRKVEAFENYLVENLAHIKTVLENQEYRCGRYTIFLIKEPKLRIVMSQSIADKIVNELVAKYILLPALDPCLIEGNVATRKGKGSNAGIYLLKKYLLEYRGKPIYVLKFDVSKYFYNIDHSILKQKLRTKIKDQSVLTLLDNIIDSTNLSYINETISNLKQSRMKKIENSKITAQEKERLFLEIERLPYYQKDKGLPIGNMTSQIFAIFYLNELDHFIKEKLHIRGYVRYMDDGVLLHPNKDYLKYCLKEIEKKLEKEKLMLNKKTVIFPIKNGIEFIGYRFYMKQKTIMIQVRGDTKRRYKKKIRMIQNKLLKGTISIAQSNQILASYQGHLQYLTYPDLWLKKDIIQESIGTEIKI